MSQTRLAKRIILAYYNCCEFVFDCIGNGTGKERLWSWTKREGGGWLGFIVQILFFFNVSLLHARTHARCAPINSNRVLNGTRRERARERRRICA